MKKIWEWLSGNVIKDVGDVIDKLTTTEEEKLQIKKEIQEWIELLKQLLTTVYVAYFGSRGFEKYKSISNK
jgi:hypothetical protein